jgi:hypothetical protein
MPLRRYLCICFVATFAMMFIALAVAPIEPPMTFDGVLVAALALALANTFVQILPFASMVPKDQRTTFWSYKWTNLVFLGLPALLFLVGVPLALLDGTGYL